MTTRAARGGVLHVSTALHTRGGVATYVRLLRDSPLWSAWSATLVATHRDGSAARKALAFAVGLAAFVRAVVVRRPRLVHLHMSAHGSFVRKATVFWMAEAVGIPAVVHVHGSEFDVFHDRAPSVVRWIIRATLTRAAVVVALGERWARRLRAIAPGACVVTIPNAVRLPPDRVRQPGAGEPVNVVFLGEIGERKGAFDLLEAWARVVPQGCAGTALLTMAGDREVERARVAVDRRGLADTVRVLSWLGPDEVAALLRSSHVLVLPSRSEGQPMAVLEAMANGLCVVTSDVGGLPEMIEDGTSGLLVPPGDVEALAASLDRVLTEPELRERLGRGARVRAEAAFDIEVVWRRLDAVYEALLAGERVAVPTGPPG
jgi:glycosyltransferase involved in cell wall biosynthesis